MTTIAVRIGKDFAEMAADSRVCDDCILQVKDQKMFKVGEALVGIAGNAAACQAFLQWFKEGAIIDDWPEHADEAQALVLFRRGKGFRCLRFDFKPGGFSPGKVAAIGTGGMAAMAAMLCGKSAAEAVKIACKLDNNSGGPIRAKRLKA